MQSNNDDNDEEGDEDKCVENLASSFMNKSSHVLDVGKALPIFVVLCSSTWDMAWYAWTSFSPQ